MSSNEPIHVDTEKLKQAAYTLLQVQQGVQSATSDFIGQCNEGSEAIGNDKTSKEFREKFDPNEKTLLQAGSDMGQQLEQFSDEVRLLVRKLGNVEQASTEAARRLNTQMNHG
jgi:hypothetical protein